MNSSDERPKVHIIVLQYAPSENKTDVFGASLDYDITLRRAIKEAEDLSLFNGVMIEGKMVWHGDDGEIMRIESIPLEGNALDLLAAST